MSNLFIAPYKLTNTASRDLAHNLGCLRIRPENSRYRWKPSDRVINWGRTRVPFPVVANQPSAVHLAVNKLSTLMLLTNAGIPTVAWTTHPEEVQSWINDGHPVYARTKLSGKGGEGIVIVNGHDDLNQLGYCPLFTRRFPTKREFRVHVAFGQVLHILEKKKRRGTNPDPFVRSHHRDWVFCQNDLAPIPDVVSSTALAAVQTLGLDFSGVDIAIDRGNQSAVFEINTAPGLEGTSLLKYTEAFHTQYHV